VPRDWNDPAALGSDDATWVVRWRSGPHDDAPAWGGPIGEGIRRAVAEDPAAQWAMADTAERWNVSIRTLQRRLHTEGHRYAALVVEGRMDAAEALLRRTRLPITVIAYVCGFSDPSHLANTCRRLRCTNPTMLRRS